MRSFSKNIAVPGGSRVRLLFTPIYGRNGLRYNITIRDQAFMPTSFIMEMDNGHLRIVSKEDSPTWASDMEKKLEEVILLN